MTYFPSARMQIRTPAKGKDEPYGKTLTANNGMLFLWGDTLIYSAGVALCVDVFGVHVNVPAHVHGVYLMCADA